jgi:hypothetical protein
MSKNTYRIHTGTVLDELGKSHTAYGIELLSGENTAVLVKDVFFDKSKVHTLVAMCYNGPAKSYHWVEKQREHGINYKRKKERSQLPWHTDIMTHNSKQTSFSRYCRAKRNWARSQLGIT